MKDKNEELREYLDAALFRTCPRCWYKFYTREEWLQNTTSVGYSAAEVEYFVEKLNEKVQETIYTEIRRHHDCGGEMLEDHSSTLPDHSEEEI